MIIGCYGELGTGKTLSAVLEAYRAYLRGQTVYSNIWLNFPHKKIETVLELFDVENGFLLLDEIWHLADSRRSMSLLNDAVSLLLLRSRKRDFDVIYTQQHYLQVDRRIRYVTDIWIKPEMIGDILKQTIISADGRILSVRLIKASDYYDLYDTKADPYTVIKLTQNKKLLEKLKELRDSFKSGMGHE
ncbi:MAG: hypothetical protein DRN49_01635 [Thaumarchaeota archaeon]|nr:MAG: hypothetical protein DRN49_01635 [Nitrososphaerota archaeon]